MKKSSFEWNAATILMIVFGGIGAAFLFTGILCGVLMEQMQASPGSRGDVTILPWIFGGIGVVFLALSAAMTAVVIKKKKNRTRLLEEGICITACVAEIRQDYLVRVKNRHPYYLICTGNDPHTGKPLTFRSRNITHHPGDMLGKSLRVYLDREDPEKYYVELQHKYDL